MQDCSYCTYLHVAHLHTKNNHCSASGVGADVCKPLNTSSEDPCSVPSLPTTWVYQGRTAKVHAALGTSTNFVLWKESNPLRYVNVNCRYKTSSGNLEEMTFRYPYTRKEEAIFTYHNREKDPTAPVTRGGSKRYTHTLYRHPLYIISLLCTIHINRGFRMESSTVCNLGSKFTIRFSSCLLRNGLGISFMIGTGKGAQAIPSYAASTTYVQMIHGTPAIKIFSQSGWPPSWRSCLLYTSRCV